MKRSLVLSIPLCIASLAATSQVNFRDADLIRLREIVSSCTSVKNGQKFSKTMPSIKHERVEIIIRYDSETALDEIKSKGGEIVSLVGTRTAIISTSPDNAIEIAASNGVSGAKLSSLIKRTNNNAMTFSNIPDIRIGKDIDKPYDGKGIVLGIFDTGIDPNHINFRDENGENRVKMVLEYAEPTANPEIYKTPAQISTFTSDTRSESHGTHVLGIMGGSFYDTSDTNAPDLRGVAPGAELIVGCGEGYNVQILDALERIGKYASEQGKPCVMNLSFGDNLGPHDGTDEFTEAINDIAEKYDAVICLSAGNERDTPCSIIKLLSDEDPYIKTLALKGYTEVEGYFQTFGSIEIWGEDNTPFEVSLDIISRSKPDDILYSLQIPEKRSSYASQGDMINEYLDTRRMDLITEGTEFQNIYSNSFMGGIAGVDTYNHRYTAQLNMYLTARSAANANRYFTRITIKGKPGKKVFMYCDGSYMSFGNRNIPGLDIPDGAGSNSNMASGRNTLAVGSYVSANITGSGYQEGTIGDISYFSSYGETPDGRIMPDICAPGQVVVSSRNTYLSTTGSAAIYYPLEYSYQDFEHKKTYYWTSCAGTSQASPHMAGIAALWRQANPNLTFSEIQQIARETASAPTFNSTGWGYGKVDALAGIKEILGSSSVFDIIDTSTEGIIIEPQGNAVYRIYAPGQDCVSATIYSIQGTEVKSLTSCSDSMTIDASSLATGVYVLKVTGSHSSRTLKFTLKQ